MFPTHPLEKIPREPLILLFIALLIGTGTFSALFLDWGELLIHPEAPGGIVNLELAWSLEGLNRVVGPWNEAARKIAIQITLADYAYILLYSSCFAAASVLIGRWARMGKRSFLERASHNVAWLAWIAAGFDAIENSASLMLLLRKPVDPWPLVMSIAASIKFLLLGVIFAFILLSALYLLVAPSKTIGEA